MAMKTTAAKQATKIERFDRSNAKALTDDAVKALQEVAERWGCRLVPAGGKFDDGAFTMKLEWRLAEVGGVSADEATFKKYCHLFHLKPEDFGATFDTPRGEAKVVGLKPSARTMPVLFEMLSTPGKRFKIGDEYVRKQLGRKAPWEDRESFKLARTSIPGDLAKMLGDAGWRGADETLGVPSDAMLVGVLFKHEDEVDGMRLGPVFAKLANGEMQPLIKDRRGSAKWFLSHEAEKVAACVGLPLTHSVA